MKKMSKDNMYLMIAASVAIGFFVEYHRGYFELDLSCYFQQVNTFKEGELDYTKLDSHNGPIAYPAGFLYIYYLISSIFPPWMWESDRMGGEGNF